MTEWLTRAFVAPLGEVYFQKAMIGACAIAIVGGVIGCLVILRRMSFLGDALSHAMIAGVAGGYLVMKLVFGFEAHAPGMLLGSLIAAVVTVALIGFVSKVSRVKEDSAIGIMYTGVFALGVVIVSVFRHYIHIDLMHFIMGDVLGISDSDLWVSVCTAAIVLSLVLLFFRQLQIVSFDPVMAASIGLPVVLLDYLLTSCVSLVVVSAVNMVGVILVVGLLITPAATAYLLSDRLSRMMWLAAVFGVTGVVGGLYLSVWLDSAGGGAVMLFVTLQFLVVLTLAPKYGLLSRWLRLKRMVPQQVTEDILGTAMRNAGRPTTAAEFQKYVEDAAGKLKFALKRMTEDGFLTADAAGGYMLTNKGEEEAGRVLRAHRLWESYLAHVGAPEGQIHARAHVLEHVRDRQTVAYLKDLLGDPKTDPHGKSIPGDTVRNGGKGSAPPE